MKIGIVPSSLLSSSLRADLYLLPTASLRGRIDRLRKRILSETTTLKKMEEELQRREEAHLDSGILILTEETCPDIE
jgi:hypothetical protein